MKILTNEILNENRTQNGGWTSAQFEIIGISWPPEKGWKSKVIGMKLNNLQMNKFIAGKNIRK